MARDKTLHADPLPRDKGKDGRSLTSNVTPTPFNTSTATPTPKLPRPAPLLLSVLANDPARLTVPFADRFLYLYS